MTETALLQAAIDHEGLDPYWHVEEAPERKPLCLVCDRPACEGAALSKFGAPVEIRRTPPDDRPALIVQDLEIEGESARIVLDWPPEGVRATLDLARRDDAWEVVDGEVVER